MKTFFLILIIARGSIDFLYIKVPFSYSIIPITCDEIYEKTVKHKYIENNGYYGFYKNKIVVAHFCVDKDYNFYNGYEEKLDWELGHE